jgi:NADPH-dependent ferric siderophore reductase
MSKPISELTVIDTERLSPGMVRLRFHSEDLSAFRGSPFTDRYVKLIFGDPAALERGAGDEAALPAIRQSLAALPETAEGYAVVLVDGPSYELPLPVPDGVELTWLHRSDPAHAGLADAVRALPWRTGRVHAFVHGEAQAVMHEIRPYLYAERGVPRGDVSISGYWRQGRTEETFRQWKAELAAIEAAAS